MTKSDLLKKAKAELLKMAQRLGLRGISTLRKEELAQRIEAAQAKTAAAAKPEAEKLAGKLATLKRRAIRKRTAQPAARRPTTRARAAAPPAAEAAVEAAQAAAHKFDVAPPTAAPARPAVKAPAAELPESYGTGRLFLAARDPHWLYVYWDLSREQLAAARARSVDQRVWLRILEKGQSQPAQELAIHDEARDWYVPVNKAATTYTAQLGIRQAEGTWVVLGQSGEATTPPDAVSWDMAVRFVNIPIGVSFGELMGMVRRHAVEGERLAETLQRLEATGQALPIQLQLQIGPWTKEQEAALQKMLGADLFRRIQAGSAEISEWLARRLAEQLGSGMFSAFSPGGASWQAAPAAKGFWFAVNAEVVIYGATEPDAKVTIGGQHVPLRPDGTFSFHYLFPDGEYHLPIVAVSRTGDERRAVELTLERATRTEGEVGAVRPPPNLTPPSA